MSSVAQPTHIQVARLYASGASDALSIAGAFDGRDDRRVTVALDEALAGLNAARDQLIAARRERAIGAAPRRHLASAVLALALMAAPWLLVGGLT